MTKAAAYPQGRIAGSFHNTLAEVLENLRVQALQENSAPRRIVMTLVEDKNTGTQPARRAMRGSSQGWLHRACIVLARKVVGAIFAAAKASFLQVWYKNVQGSLDSHLIGRSIPRHDELTVVLDTVVLECTTQPGSTSG